MLMLLFHFSHYLGVKTQVVRWTRKSCSPILGGLNMFEAQKVADFK